MDVVEFLIIECIYLKGKVVVVWVSTLLAYRADLEGVL